MAHCTTLLIDLTPGKRIQILGETRGVCAKVAFLIQYQRYLWNEAV